MTNIEFKQHKFIDFLKQNLFFLGNYTGPIDFLDIDYKYASFISHYKVAFLNFTSSLNNLSYGYDIDEETLARWYIEDCNNLYNSVFYIHTSNKLKMTDILNLLEWADTYNTYTDTFGYDNLILWQILCYLLEIKYHKKFSYGYFVNKQNKKCADFVCPADTSEIAYDEVSTWCWDEEVSLVIRF